jgi:hypothetical protein
VFFVAGWYVDRSSNFSIRAYCREHARRVLPLPYSSDSQSDDLPYWVPSPIKDEPGTGEDAGLLMIPVSQDCSDMRFNVRGAGWAGPDDFFKHLVSTTGGGSSTINTVCPAILYESEYTGRYSTCGGVVGWAGCVGIVGLDGCAWLGPVCCLC